MNDKRLKIGIGIAIAVALLAAVVVFFNDILWLAGAAVKLFLPFILGAVFAFVTNPLADVFEKRFKIPRNIAAILVILICLGIIGGICTMIIAKIINEIQSIVRDPSFMINLENTFSSLSSRFTGVYSGLPDEMQQTINDSSTNILKSLSGLLSKESTPFFRSASNIAKSIPGIFIGSIVFLLSSFFMISESSRIGNFMNRIVSKKTYKKLTRMKTEVKQYIGGYIKAQFIIMMVAFVVLSIGFAILKIDHGFLIAAVTAMFDALPFFGSGAVLWPWAIVSLISADYTRAIGCVIIYLCVIFTRQMIEPKIVSHKIGMNPLLTLMSMYVGYRLFSIGGMIFGPLLMMLFISFKRAGFFDEIIEFFSLMKKAISKEYTKFKKSLRSND